MLNIDQSLRVSVGEAARLFGVNPRTVQRAIKENKLRYIVVKNRYKILFSSLVSWS
ncbi:helix-turn-helix domain-containing protein, partial [Candidatus Uhrbacteria bacterium]|nr:helix-turn-helix domain-containing protein [Candidatus Uhrbacteria bacterium]